MSKRKKKPKHKENPHPKKTAKIDPQISPDSIIDKKPTWRIGMIDFGGPWGWNKIKDSSILLTIQERLKNVESMKWAEIENRHNHFIQVKNIGKEAKKRLREINLEDCDTLFSFRVTGKKRLWGIRDNEVLNILWWDPDHTVYPVKR